ncbi:MAG TPA: chromosome partitioning protein ParB [Roseibacterium sp.]|nr:chromosome partitioning protein ParB [Roseibacterium sp.]
MAKRKRLTPAQPDYFSTNTRAPEVKSMPGPTMPDLNAAPIAQVAEEAATHAALNEVSGVLRDARTQGRLIEALPLGSINARYMLRDRILNKDDEDMRGLIVSLRARGQQTPIEVIALPDAKGPAKYGLISGWRRLTALNSLYEETDESRFATIKALVISPDTAQDAYVAMVEENEVRVNLSLYERARIALHAAGEGVFPTARHAILALFETTPRAKRSKISSFVALVNALDLVLMHPKAISEKLGLQLVKALAADPELKEKLRARLTYEDPRSVADEQRILSEEMMVSQQAMTVPEPESECADNPILESESGAESESDFERPPASGLPYTRPDAVAPGLWLRFDNGTNPRIELSGSTVDHDLCQALKAWLAEKYK